MDTGNTQGIWYPMAIVDHIEDLAHRALGTGRILIDMANGSDAMDRGTKEALIMLGTSLYGAAYALVETKGSPTMEEPC